MKLLEPHEGIRPHCPWDQGTMERAIRDVKQWLQACRPRSLAELSACLGEGLFMLNFLKPRLVLDGRTPAAAYWSKPLVVAEVAA